MKKIPVTESDELKKQPDAEQTDGDDPVAGLQADLDRFRDLAMRSQADFENYKRRSAREKQEAIKYANTSLLEKLVSIVDHFELGCSRGTCNSPDPPRLSVQRSVAAALRCCRFERAGKITALVVFRAESRNLFHCLIIDGDNKKTRLLRSSRNQPRYV